MSNYTPTVIETLSNWSDKAYEDHTRKFLKIFCKGDAWILNSVSWNDENMHFSYVLRSGQHVGDSVKLEEWYKFLEDDYNGKL